MEDSKDYPGVLTEIVQLALVGLIAVLVVLVPECLKNLIQTLSQKKLQDNIPKLPNVKLELCKRKALNMPDALTNAVHSSHRFNALLCAV